LTFTQKLVVKLHIKKNETYLWQIGNRNNRNLKRQKRETFYRPVFFLFSIISVLTSHIYQET